MSPATTTTRIIGVLHGKSSRAHIVTSHFYAGKIDATRPATTATVSPDAVEKLWAELDALDWSKLKSVTSKVTDLGGNELTFTRGGRTHSFSVRGGCRCTLDAGPCPCPSRDALEAVLSLIRQNAD